MAFPGTLNLSYYKGDTLEFRVQPKDTSDNVFDLTGYTSAKFTIATGRGRGSLVDSSLQATLDTESKLISLTSGDTSSLYIGLLLSGVYGSGAFAEDTRITSIVNESDFYISNFPTTAGVVVFEALAQFSGLAEITVDKQYVFCALPPTVGNYLYSDTTYVYDVEIKKPSSPYDYVYTLLNGTISVTDEVTPTFTSTQISVETTTTTTTTTTPAPPTSPDVPTDFSVDSITSSSVEFSWTPASTGDPADSYYVAVSSSPDPTNTSAIVYASSTPQTETSFVIPAGLDSATTYYVVVVPYNASGDYDLIDFATAYITTGGLGPLPGLTGFFVTEA